MTSHAEMICIERGSVDDNSFRPLFAKKCMRTAHIKQESVDDNLYCPMFAKKGMRTVQPYETSQNRVGVKGN